MAAGRCLAVLTTAHPASHSNDLAQRRQSQEDRPVTTQRRRPDRGWGARGSRARMSGARPTCGVAGAQGLELLRPDRRARDRRTSAPPGRPLVPAGSAPGPWCNSQGLEAAGWARELSGDLGNALCLEGQVSATVCGPSVSIGWAGAPSRCSGLSAGSLQCVSGHVTRPHVTAPGEELDMYPQPRRDGARILCAQVTKGGLKRRWFLVTDFVISTL